MGPSGRDFDAVDGEDSGDAEGVTAVEVPADQSGLDMAADAEDGGGDEPREGDGADRDGDDGGDADDGGDGEIIPPVLLRAMKDRMRSRHLSEPDDPDFVRCRLGVDYEAVYVIDDGPDRCLVGRLVGRSHDGCTYCLVAPIPLFHFEQLETGDVALEDAFSQSRDIALCGVFEDEMGGSNLFVVEHFRRAGDVPEDYLPPNPFLEFTDEDQPGDQ